MKYGKYTMLVASLMMGAVVAVAQMQPSSDKNAASLTNVDQSKAQLAIQFNTPKFAPALKAITPAAPKAGSLIKGIMQRESSPPRQSPDWVAFDINLAGDILGLAQDQATTIKNDISLDAMVKRGLPEVNLSGRQYLTQAVLTDPKINLESGRLELSHSQKMVKPAFDPMINRWLDTAALPIKKLAVQSKLQTIVKLGNAALALTIKQPLNPAVLLNKDLATHAAFIVPDGIGNGYAQDREYSEVVESNVSLISVIPQHSLQDLFGLGNLGEVRAVTIKHLPSSEAKYSQTLGAA